MFGVKTKEDDQTMNAKKTFVFVAAVMAGLASASGAMASDPQRMLTEKDWQAFRVEDDKGRTCFISSVPTKSAGKYDP